jgi:hypothetical protein
MSGKYITRRDKLLQTPTPEKELKTAFEKIANLYGEEAAKSALSSLAKEQIPELMEEKVQFEVPHILDH